MEQIDVAQEYFFLWGQKYTMGAQLILPYTDYILFKNSCNAENT